MPKVKFLPLDITIEVDSYDSLLSAAQKAGLTSVECCGMNPLCGECKVSIVDGEGSLTAARAKELEYCKSRGFLPYQRLGCLARIVGNDELWVELERYTERRGETWQKADLES